MMLHPTFSDTTLGASFSQVVRSYGSSVALQDGSQTWTYEDLDTESNRVAHTLMPLRKNDTVPLVALCVPQGFPFISSLLGVLKAGCAFIPLDPTYPAARNQRMLDNGRPKAFVFQGSFPPQGLNLEANCLRVDREDLNSKAIGPPEAETHPSDLAVILYTSGSSGEPKGVRHTHQSLLHNVHRHTHQFGLTSSDKQTLLYPCSVYGGLRDILNTLLNGGELHHYPVKEKGVVGLADWLATQKITVYCSVVTVFRHFARELQGATNYPHLRLIKLGGEAPLRGDIDLFKAHFHPKTRLSCGLASTETGMTREYPITHSTRLDGHGVPLGYAVPDVGVEILDEHHQPVPPGTVGEIAITSHYLSQGYHELPAQTKAAFLNRDSAGGRSYLTGDLGLLDQAGCLYHHGRKDNQVKIRGNRIELLDIESVIQTMPGVKDSVVIAEKDRNEEYRLIAYVVPASSELDLKALRSSLRDKLPPAWIPSLFLGVEAIPLTPNGKTDRKALPKPTSQTSSADLLPANQVEQQLSALWKSILRIDHLGTTDDFFELGGNSLNAIRLLSDIEKAFKTALPLSSLFTAPTVKSLARIIAAGEPDHASSGVVTLNGDGDEPPVFFLPGVGGTVYSYRELAGALDIQRPCYGLQIPGLDGAQPIPQTVPDMASLLVKRIRTQQGSGPYALCGFSFGGIVAQEMARQLTELGETVDPLILLDSSAPGARRKLSVWSRARTHATNVLSLNRASRIDYLKSRWNRAKSTQQRKNQDQANKPTTIGSLLDEVWAATRKAGRSHTPSFYPGTIHLIAANGHKPWMRFESRDPHYGWSAFAQRVSRSEIDGYHLEILTPALAHELAKQLKPLLRTP